MPADVKAIGSSAFRTNEKLSKIKFTEGLTTIGDWAFAYCYGLKDVYIPASVNTIDKAAFFYIKNLETITCSAIQPPVATSSTFDSSIFTKCSLMVPENSIDAYKGADIWKKFTNISKINNGTGIESLPGEGDGETLGVYTLSGSCVADNCQSLDAGIYLIVRKSAGKVTTDKILVK